MLEFLKRAVSATRKRKREQEESANLLAGGSAPPLQKRQRMGGDDTGPEWFFPCAAAAPLFNGPAHLRPPPPAPLGPDGIGVVEEGPSAPGEQWQECQDQADAKRSSEDLLKAVESYLKECQESRPSVKGGNANTRKKHRRRKRRKKKEKKEKKKQQQQHLGRQQQAESATSAGRECHSAGEEEGGEGEATVWDIAERRPLKERREEDSVSHGEYIAEDDPLRPPEAPLKYWVQRFRFFSRFDEGIRMDEEGWYSVTPEEIAKHIAERCACDLIVDAFCGVGGNTIQFALTCNRVIAIDNDAERLKCAQHNAKVYGVEDRIDFILGDYFDIIKRIRADVVFLSPPWGGPDYLDSDVFDVHDMGGMDGSVVMQYARMASHNIAYFLPRNVDSVQLLALAPDSRCEVEGNYLNAKLKTVTAYYGDLIYEGEEGAVDEEGVEAVAAK